MLRDSVLVFADSVSRAADREATAAADTTTLHSIAVSGYSNEDAATQPERRMSDVVAVPVLTSAEAVAASAEPLRADPWRFAVGFTFSLLSIINAMQWIAFSPIVAEVRTFFAMSAVQVNFLATTYVIAYVVIVFLSCKLYEVTGIKLGVLLAAVTNLTGASLKLIALYAWPHAPLLYLSQVLNSFTEVLTIATPPLICNRWFPEKERTVATTVLSSALNFGCGVGVLIPTFFVSPGRAARGDFARLFWFHFGLSALALLLSIVAFPKKPRYHASYTAAHQQHKEEARLRALGETLRRRRVDSASATVVKERAAETSSARVDLPLPTLSEPGGVGAASQASGGTVYGEVGEVEWASRASASEPVQHAGGTTPLRRRHATATALLPESGVKAGAMRRGMWPVHTGTRRTERDELDEDSEDEVAVVRVNIFSVIVDCYRECRHNLSFVLLSLASAAELGLIWAVATVLPQMLTPYGVSEAMAGWIGFLNLVLGTVVCPCFMPLVERFGRRYKHLLCILALVLLLNMIALTLLLHFGPAAHGRYYVIVAFVLWGGVAGLCQNFMMPLMFEYVVELTFPMAESTSAPLLTWAACLTNFLLATAFGEVLTDTPTELKALRVFIGATVVTAVGAVALFFTKPLHKRTDYESLRKEQQRQLLPPATVRVHTTNELDD